MEESSFHTLTHLQNEVNTDMEQINSSTSPETVLSTTSDLNQLSSELFQILLPSTIFFTVLNCVGVPSNLLVLLVYFRKFKVSATRVFVVVIAGCDFFVNILTIPLLLVYYRHTYTIARPAFCAIKYLMLRFPLYLSCLVLVCVNLDRRRRVCHPFRRQLTARQATFTLVVPVGLVALATFPFVAFYTGMQFKTTVGLTVRKCSFQTKFPGDIFKLVEGILLAVYCIVGLALAVGSYLNILHRVKQQTSKSCQKINHDDFGQPDPKISDMILSTTSRKLEEEVESKADSESSRDQETCVDWLECENRDQKVEEPSKSSSVALPGGREMNLAGHQKLLASKTTLVMFVLTITTVVCLVPFIIWTYFPDTLYEKDMSPWIMNLGVASVYLPSLRSAINPFIYLYFNQKFRPHCQQFLNFGVSYFYQ